MRSLLPLLALAALGCKNPEKPLLEVPEDRAWTLPTLQENAHIVFTEGHVPHIYAENRRDLAVVWGFQVARDRFFMMDLSRRLALGELSEVLGEDALSADMESRAEGNRHIAEQMLVLMEEHHPELLELVDAYAEGVNAYLAAVRAEKLPPPSEYAFAATTLGAESPIDLMTDFDRLDVIAGAATVIAQSGFESGDVRRGYTVSQLADWYAGADHEDLRQAGVRADIWDRVEPTFDVASAPEWDPAAHPRDGASDRARGHGDALGPVPAEPIERILARRARWDRFRGHDWEHGWGSNAWAVHASATDDGRALLAGDGHLGLTIPPLFYQIGLDVKQLSKDKDELSFVGMTVPGLPVPGPGTNGYIAWSQIAFFGDITDWYREEIQLDGSGNPVAAKFDGEWVPLVAVEESATVRDIPALDSEGGTRTWTRWTTADGRWIADIEGRRGNDPGDGETVVWMGGDRVIPGDTDGDGIVTGISFDYPPLDGSPAVVGLWGFAEARTVDDFHEATKDLNGNSAGLIAADRDGSILYTGFQAVPCRSYLPRNADGSFVEGADPSLLIDGTTYPGFTVPLVDGHIDYSQRDDPQRCLVPFEDYPWSKDPTQGFLVAANNDPGGQSFDVDVTNDGWYVGGPWLEGYRADTIARELDQMASEKSASIANMQELQANHDSRLGEQFVPVLLDALDRAETLAQSEQEEGSSEARIAAAWDADAERFAEVRTRLQAWVDGGYQAESGVETFYDTVADGDVADSVATSIFNAWYGRFARAILDDERIPPGAFYPTGDSGRQRLLKRIVLEGRGPDNPAGIASFNPDTGESIYFDVNGTPELETSDELAVVALTDALDFLTGPRSEKGYGGFGTEDMDAWTWGLRHHVRFDSVLAEFLGDDPTFSALTSGFSITPGRIDVWPGAAPNDPRYGLPGFPRHGDHLNVDAGNSGVNGERFSYGSGPVFRLVVALGADGPEGVNVLPGGQSGLNDSEYFDDQAQLWLGNEAMELQYTVDEVVGAAIGREAFLPE